MWLQPQRKEANMEQEGLKTVSQGRVIRAFIGRTSFL
jgi:hypothetical protein